VTESIHLASVYRMHAVIFWESAKILFANMELQANGKSARYGAIPFYYLVSHSAELFLKSALLKRGWTEQDVMKREFRHSLSGLLEELQSKGVSVTEKTVVLLNGLHSQHKDHDLRYTVLIDDGKKTFIPPPGLLLSMLEELLSLTAISTQGV
jgi:hypothetical protein